MLYCYVSYIVDICPFKFVITFLLLPSSQSILVKGQFNKIKLLFYSQYTLLCILRILQEVDKLVFNVFKHMTQICKISLLFTIHSPATHNDGKSRWQKEIVALKWIGIASDAQLNENRYADLVRGRDSYLKRKKSNQNCQVYLEQRSMVMTVQLFQIVAIIFEIDVVNNTVNKRKRFSYSFFS